MISLPHDAIPVVRYAIHIVCDAITILHEGGNLHWAVLYYQFSISP